MRFRVQEEKIVFEIRVVILFIERGRMEMIMIIFEFEGQEVEKVLRKVDEIMFWVQCRWWEWEFEEIRSVFNCWKQLM